MTSKNNRPYNAAGLRKRAETIAREKAAQPQEDIEDLSPEAIREKLHELSVNQIELDMQKEELRKAQVELDNARTSYLDFYNLSPVGFCSISKQGLIIKTNLTTVTLLGASQDDLINQPFTRFIHNEDQDIYHLHSKRLFESGDPQTCDLRMLKMNDTIFWAHLAATTVLDVSGVPVCSIVLSDITERKQMERHLRKSESLLSSIFRAAPTGIGVVSNRILLAVNNRVCDMIGYSQEEMIGQSARMMYPSDAHFENVGTEKYRQILQYGTGTVETQWRCKDGRIIDILMSSTPINPMDLAAGVTFTALDITERKKADDALRESEAKHRLLFENANDAIFIHDMQARMLAVNTVACERLDYTHVELMSLTVNQVNPPEEDQNVRERISQLMEQGHLTFETRHVSKDGSSVPTEVSSRRITWDDQPAIMSVCRDITERKRAEMEKDKLQSQLQQALKMEAIGTLAGGIAHDFNNLLMVIQGRASLISWELEVSHPLQEHIHAIEEQIRSATRLTQQLLGFARGGKYEVDPVDMNELVHGSSAMFGRTKKEIRIHTKCQESPLVVDADRGQIEQVLLNMYINAWQSIPLDGGELYLETKIVTLNEAYCKPHQTAPGRYVKVSITDTGVGMNEATRQQIFDPFFTTKVNGRGTGMGLASAYGIIKNHSGMITVYSEVGHGTTFNIYLPISEKEAYLEVPLEGGLIKGSATILLVDDEDLIIDVGQSMLERLGYRVLVCREGLEGVKVITDMGAEIDLVILDMIMPGMDGGTTFNRIREIQPDMPVLLSSGYAMNSLAEKIMRRGCNGFIQKPYNISELSQKIRKVLDKVKGSTPGLSYS